MKRYSLLFFHIVSSKYVKFYTLLARTIQFVSQNYLMKHYRSRKVAVLFYVIIFKLYILQHKQQNSMYCSVIHTLTLQTVLPNANGVKLFIMYTLLQSLNQCPEHTCYNNSTTMESVIQL